MSKLIPGGLTEKCKNETIKKKSKRKHKESQSRKEYCNFFKSVEEIKTRNINKLSYIKCKTFFGQNIKQN